MRQVVWVLFTLSAGVLPGAHLPLVFERNEGQASNEIRFLARAAGYTVLVSSDAIAVQTRAARFRMRFAGARQPRLEALELLPGKVNYIFGREPRAWRTGIPTFGSVRYRGIYRSVDLILHPGDDGQLEYDFQLGPGGDPSVIQLSFEGVRPVRIDADGNLILQGPGGDWLQHKPRILQNGQIIGGGYKLLDDGDVAFSVGHYDRTKPLVIDPVISFSTYLGGAITNVTSIAVDDQKNVYVTGNTSSPDFPVTNGTYDSHCNSTGFVSKLNAEGSALIYSTFIGGTVIPSGIVVDAEGNAYVTGVPCSDLPVTKGALRNTMDTGTEYEGFLLKLDPTGRKLLYATYLGGGQAGAPLAGMVGPVIALSSSGDLYLAGTTGSPSFPLLNALQSQPNTTTCFLGFMALPCDDAFVMHWRASDMTLLYSTYLGGSGDDDASAVAVDSHGNAYVTGRTYSADFPINKVFDGGSRGMCQSEKSASLVLCGEAFVVKISADGRHLLYAISLGGSGDNVATSIAVGSDGSAYVAGATNSPDFPAVNAFSSTLQDNFCRNADGSFGTAPSCGEGFVAKLQPDGSGLQFSTYFGGIVTSPGEMVVDAAGNAFVAFSTFLRPSINGSMRPPPDLPLTSATLSPCAGGWAGQPAVLAEFGPDGSLLYSTLLGGTDVNFILGMAVDGSGGLYLAGLTRSGDFPITPGSFEPDLPGDITGFLTKIDLTSPPPTAISLAPACIVNASTYMNWSSMGTASIPNSRSGSVSPGEIITIIGNGLGPVTGAGAVLDAAGRVATSLAGVAVTFDGVAAPLLYAQSNQINAIVPFEVAGKEHTTIQLQYNGTASNTVRMWVADSVPGFFTLGGLGQQIAALNQDGTMNSSANPAPKGSIVSLWGTGLGTLNQAYADGEIVTGPLGTVINQQQIAVDGATAEIQYMGQAPEQVAGAMQVNLVVPDTVRSGADQVCVLGAFGCINLNATIWVK